MEKLIRSAALSAPDPERSLKNLTTFFETNPDYTEMLEANIHQVSQLFSYSQFLSNFCVSNPYVLFDVLKNIDTPQDKHRLTETLKEALASSRDPMKTVRGFKKKELLRITLRDILKKTELIENMLELSMLADTITAESLKIVRNNLSETYGSPDAESFAVISLGKLGSEELNFSSDIDLVFVYGKEEGETSGIVTPHGTTANRISSHEYYCKLGENLNRFLSMNTEDGFAYRVDLRLRPEGQRGSIALSLPIYETYYESWGRAWERAMLIRARPIAGDLKLGEKFIEAIKPFVYRKYLDYGAIDEIRRIKTRIDSSFKKNDIKRGYGGIREIEFFVHAMQLIYAGKEPLLRERSTLKALHLLLQKNLIGQSDYSTLSENYIFLRTLEHRLQQMNDLQTHTLPTEENELAALGSKMGFPGRQAFLSSLENRRNSVRAIYNSLFRGEGEKKPGGSIFFDEELSDAELREFLYGTGLKDIERGLRNIKHIKDSTYQYQTLRGRKLLSEILPEFVDAAIKSSNPDMALNHLQPFAVFLSARESYLDTFKENKELIQIIVNLFSQSEYLSKTLIKRPDYLELTQEMPLKKSLKKMKDDLSGSLKSGQSLGDAIRTLKQTEELRLGMLFLEKKKGITELGRELSRAAEAILSESLEHLGRKFSIIGFGKLGGREITFGSDIDLIFATGSDVKEEQTKIAEKLLRLIVSYTRDGIAYRVDMRLRPDGTKGPLISSLDSFRQYYSKSAAPWELQALLKARPVGGDIKTGLCFISMAKEILTEQGHLISAFDVRAMRERIQRELSKDAEGYDVKLGYGGLEDLEFAVQYLQLKNCEKHQSLLVHGTLDAIKRMEKTGVIKTQDAVFMHDSYIFYRTLETFLRLREKDILKRDNEELFKASAGFLGLKDTEELITRLEETRTKIRGIYDLLVV